jgi:hypothetical protein
MGVLVTAPPASRAETPAPPSVPQSRAECEAAGGTWDDVQGLGHVLGCNPRTTDAGKVCTDSDQCEGACQRGKCSGSRFVRGCGILRHGQTLCID